MRKIDFILLTVLIAASLCSCNKTDYQNVIPANATFVAKVDVRTIVEKGDFAQSSAVDMMKGSLALVVNGKDLKQTKAYIDDPMTMGLDWSMPAYAFMVGNECAGLTLKVADEDAVTDFLLLLHKQQLATKPVERHELMCGTLLDEIAYSYDGKTFLLLASLDEGRGMKLEQLAHQLINQGEEESFVGTEAYKKMEEGIKDVVVYSNLAALPTNMIGVVQEFLPKSIKKSDMELLTSVDFVAGAAMIQTSVWGKTDKAQQLINEANEGLRMMEGRYIEKASDDMLAWMGMGVKGEWLLKKMKEDKKMNEKLFLMERAIDIEQMLRAVDGDVAVVLPQRMMKDGHDESFIAYAQLKSNDFLQEIDEWKADMKEYGMSMQDDGNHHYVLHTEGNVWQWGVDGNDLYFVPDGAWGHTQTADCSNELLKAHEQDIKNSLFFVYMNVGKMGLDRKLKGEMAMIRNPFQSIEAVSLKSSSVNEITLVIEAKDKKENILKQIL